MKAFVLPFLLLLAATNAAADVWERQVADTAARYPGAHCSLRIDGEGVPHLSYYDEEFSDLRYAVRRNGIWHIQVVDSAQNVGNHTSLALDARNRPHISYQGQYLRNEWALKHATLTDTGWVVTQLDSESTAASWESSYGYETCIDVSDSGYPHISSTTRSTGYNVGYLRHSYMDALGWHHDSVWAWAFGNAYSRTWMRLIDGRIPVVGWFARNNDSLAAGIPAIRILKSTPGSGGWSLLGVPDSNISYRYYGEHLDMRVDAAGNIYCLYVTKPLNEWNRLKLAVHDGTRWTLEEITTEYYTITGSSLCVEANGTIHFVYCDETKMRYGKRVGGVWQFQDVERRSAEGTAAGDLSLALSPAGLPRVGAQYVSPGSWRKEVRYYQYWPGSPAMTLPNTSHEYGPVWIQSQSDWKCPVVNTGIAPLIIYELRLSANDTFFLVRDTRLPLTAYPGDTAWITIRFKPVTDRVYRDSMRIVSNDPAMPSAYLHLSGTGSTTGTEGTLALAVRRVYVDHGGRIIRYDMPLAEARVDLLHGGQPAYGPFFTGPDGRVAAGTVPVGSYQVRIAKALRLPGVDTLRTLSLLYPITVGPGSNTADLEFPDSLLSQAYGTVYSLSHVGVPGRDVLFAYPAAIPTRQQLDAWWQFYPAGTHESIARLILADSIVTGMFASGFLIGEECSNDIAELLNVMFYSNCWANSVLEIIATIVKAALTGGMSLAVDMAMELIEMIVKTAVMEMVGEAVEYAAARLPDTPIAPSQRTPEDLVMAAWRDLKDQFTGARAFSQEIPFLRCAISQSNWSHLQGVVFDVLRDAFFQYAYIDGLTDPAAADALRYAQTPGYERDLRWMYDGAMDFMSDRKQEVATAHSVCSNSVEAARLFDFTYAIMNGVASFLPALEIVAIVSQVATYALVVEAVGYSAYEFFTLPQDIRDAVQHVFFYGTTLSPPGAPARAAPIIAAYLPADLRANLRMQMQQRLDSYDSVMLRVRGLVGNGQIREAFESIPDLERAERDLKVGFKLSTAPIRAAAHAATDSVAGFTAVYDSLIAAQAAASVARFTSYLHLGFLPGDSTRTLRPHSLAQFDAAMASQHALAERISATLDTVSAVPIPAVLGFSDVSQSSRKLSSGRAARVTARIRNVGAVAADSVWLVLEKTPALEVTSPESLFIGSLAAGAASPELAWTVSLASSGYDKGELRLLARSATSRPSFYSFTFATPLSVTPSTGGKLESENVYSYPNPFSPDLTTATMRYSLARTATVTIRIYDAGGVPVRTVVTGVQQEAGEEQAVAWDGRNAAGDVVANGVYFFVITSSQGERAVGKIAVLR